MIPEIIYQEKGIIYHGKQLIRDHITKGVTLIINVHLHIEITCHYVYLLLDRLYNKAVNKSFD